MIGGTALAFLYLVLAAIQRSGLLLAYRGRVVSVALTAAVLLCLVWVLPRRTSNLWDLWPGPVVGTHTVGAAGQWLALSVPVPIRTWAMCRHAR